MKPVFIAGPCVIESMDCLREVAREVKRLKDLYNAKDYANAKPVLSALAVSRNPAIKAKAIELLQYIMQKERPSVFL